MKWDIVSGQVGCGSSEMATEFVISMNSEIISRVWGHLARKNFIRYIVDHTIQVYMDMDSSQVQ